jgi:hypothetical protein
VAPPSPHDAQPPVIEVVEEPVIPTPIELQAFALQQSLVYGASFHEMSLTIDGESEWTTHACGDGGASCNIAQFQVPTFNWFRAEAVKQGQPFENLDYHDAYDQITLMAWAFSQGEAYKEHWTCYRARVSGTLPLTRCPF